MDRLSHQKAIELSSPKNARCGLSISTVLRRQKDYSSRAANQARLSFLPMDHVSHSCQVAATILSSESTLTIQRRFFTWLLPLRAIRILNGRRTENGSC